MKKVYELTKEELIESVPPEVVEDVADLLKAFDVAHITFENRNYHVSAGMSIRKTYAPDHKYIGTVYLDSFYSKEEQIVNYANEFYDFHPAYKGKRDYLMMKEAKEGQKKFQLVEGIITVQ